MRIIVSLICGTIFGFGLYVSAMIDPQKVLGFLDIWAIAEGGWDPSLAFVMGGGLAGCPCRSFNLPKNAAKPFVVAR